MFRLTVCVKPLGGTDVYGSTLMTESQKDELQSRISTASGEEVVQFPAKSIDGQIINIPKREIFAWFFTKELVS